MYRTFRTRAACLILTLLTARCVHALVPEASEGVEFHFTGAPGHLWRGVRSVSARRAPSPDDWVGVVSASGERTSWLGDRVVLRFAGHRPPPDADLALLGLRRSRTISPGLAIYQARDPWAAARAAHTLSGRDDVEVAMPVMRRRLALHNSFAPRPNDPYFTNQWHLENRDSAGLHLGPDTNPRAAWTLTRGSGVTVAIADDGFEVDHPDLQAAAAGAPHFDFTRHRTNAAVYGAHATCVAGLVGASGDNRIGVTGLAPQVRLANWSIFDSLGDIVSDEGLMDMFQYRIEEVAVQNHSWGNADITLSGPTPIEAEAISNAIEHGRDGRGTLFVRSGGNGREGGSNVNDDGYPNDPRVIAVAAVRRDGRAASYSNPGACLLVGAPSGDDSDTFAPTLNICTTDRTGARGYHQSSLSDDGADYTLLDATGFSGTSASAPQISGIVALILAANPDLTYRDVQQVLAMAARHQDLADPDLRANGAGFAVSHNQGFGVPDAGQAVRLARAWSNRPPVVILSATNSGTLAVPDDGLRVWVTSVGGGETGLQCQPAEGPHPDRDTARVPLVFVGQATNDLAVDLRGRAALIERGGNYFRDKVTYAARAGAAFAVIFNHLNDDEIFVPQGTDFVPIPAVLIGENDGRALLARLEAGETVATQLRLEAVRKDFEVRRSLACEHVGLRVRSNHEVRGDLRITLLSPAGTRSVLQALNQDQEAGPEDWTYWSVQNFYESSVGTWQAWFSDEAGGNTGEILEAELIVRGVAIEDTDADGLDDAWERRAFGGLAAGSRDDPDRDGYCNAREQVLQTDPNHADADLRIDVAPYDERSVRLGWPASGAYDYRLFSKPAFGSDERLEVTLPGRIPELDWVAARDVTGQRFFRVEAVPPNPADGRTIRGP